jgi:hypothetical protein
LVLSQGKVYLYLILPCAHIRVTISASFHQLTIPETISVFVFLDAKLSRFRFVANQLKFVTVSYMKEPPTLHTAIIRESSTMVTKAWQC